MNDFLILVMGVCSLGGALIVCRFFWLLADALQKEEHEIELREKWIKELSGEDKS